MGKVVSNIDINIKGDAVCILKSKTGIIGTLTAGWTYYGNEDNSTVIYCSNGIITGTPPEVSGEEGLKALKIILACMESEKVGTAVKV